MSRVCQVTGKKPSSGHNVSHSQRKTKRRWIPNLITKKIFDPIKKRFVKMRISTNALRTLTKQMASRGKV
jgi:large subunit ribosomal protein L28